MSDEELKELTKLATKLLDDLGYVAPELRRVRAMSALLRLLDKVAGGPKILPVELTGAVVWRGSRGELFIEDSKGVVQGWHEEDPDPRKRPSPVMLSPLVVVGVES